MAHLTEVVAQRLRAHRRARGLTQAALAEAAGVSTELVSRIERARCLPSLRTLVACAEALQVTPNQLLGYESRNRSREAEAILDAVRALPRAQRRNVRRIAEALARYERLGEED